jgi:serine/threonine-protein kinase
MDSDLKSAPTLPAPTESERNLPFAGPPGGPKSLVGTVIDGRYHVERLIGEGGMGFVYLARHRVIDKRVAIKVLRTEMARDTEMTERFLQEARTASSIGNGHIVDVSDFGILPEGATYFVMEHLDGPSLTGQLTDLGPLSPSRVMHIAKQIAQGLGAAHAAGIVHRDLKPDNIMLIARGQDRDFVKILDFGIAKVATQNSKITRAGSIFGTPHYMAPEQASGGSVDARTDVYSLGVIMYEMISGRVPFDADAVMGVLSQHLYKPPVHVHVAAARDDVPASLEAIVMKCLAKDPDARYRSMDALADDIDAVERGLEPLATLEGGSPSSSMFEPPTATSGVALANPQAAPRRFSPRGATAATVGLVLVIMGAGVFTLVSWRSHSVAPIVPVAAAAQPLPDPAPALAPPPAAAPQEKLLLLSTEPLDAKISRDGQDLGTPPVAIRLKEGERVSILVSRPGYLSRAEMVDAALLDGPENKHIVRLLPVPGARGAKSAAPKPSGRPTISEHDDPWKRALPR